MSISIKKQFSIFAYLNIKKVYIIKFSYLNTVNIIIFAVKRLSADQSSAKL